MSKIIQIFIITALVIVQKEYSQAQCFKRGINESDLIIDQQVQQFCAGNEHAYLVSFISYNHNSHNAHLVSWNDQSDMSIVTVRFLLGQQQLNVSEPTAIDNDHISTFEQIAANNSGTSEYFTSCLNTFRMDQPYLVRVLIKDNKTGQESIYEINSLCLESLQANSEFQDLYKVLEYLQIK
ncbi:MAG: hypothetical protein NXI20_18655 [bacterium]|nr:hypothetical protein [bacterium]